MRSQLTVFLLGTLLLAAGPQRPDEAAFELALGRVHELMADADWAAAQSTLLAALDTHGAADYVLLRRRELRDDFTRCALRQAVPEPDLDTLISGDLLSYDRRSGDIVLRYRGADTLGDFTLEHGISWHPLTFDGPYSIEIRGSSYRAAHVGRTVRRPTLLVGVHADQAYSVAFGYTGTTARQEIWVPAEIAHQTSVSRTVLDDVEKPRQALGKRFRLGVSLGERFVTATHNNRGVLKARRVPGDAWGGLGFGHVVEFDELTIRGRAQHSWFQGLVDAELRDVEQAWLAAYSPDRQLPAWLAGAPQRADLPPAPVTIQLPWRIDTEQQKTLTGLTQLIAEQRTDEALESYERAATRRLPTGIQHLLAAQILLELGQAEEALEHARAVVDEQPDFEEGRLVLAQVLAAAGDRSAALREFASLHAADARRPEVFIGLAHAYLLAGQAAEAEQILVDAQRGGVHHPLLERLRDMLVKARRGPEFARRFESSQGPYRVVSDIDARLCRVACAELLATRELAATLLGPLDEAQRAVPVYLFSGHRGYTQYTHDLLEPTHSTAGLYSPSLKQLLIWNLPDRDEMLATVRHEGVHREIDGRGADPPAWLGEGLAEYIALMERDRRGRVVDDKLHALYARLLAAAAPGLLPLDHFLRLDTERFYSVGSLAYAQAWALVHFLRHGDAAPPGLFDQLLAGMLAGQGHGALLDATFGQHDMPALERDFLAYVVDLAD